MALRRVVVTGLGIVSSLGNNKEEVLASLKAGRSGIEYNPEYAELGFRSHLSGPVKIDLDALIDRKWRRFMGDGAAYNYLAMLQALADAGLPETGVSDPRVGLIVGSGGGSTANTVAATDIMRNRGARKVGPTMVPRVMGSTNSACLSTAFQIKGVSYTISSACATSAHCIGNAYELIQLGKQDMIFAGGGEEVHWTDTLMFDAMGALSQRNDDPKTASRAYDANRDGFVISGGGGVLVLEELGHAERRGARILAEVVGYGATSDGFDMVKPSGEGATRCMQLALQNVDTPIEYINAHGTSTPAGDIAELEAIKAVFGDAIPSISSTKSLSGHALGAAGVNEAIYSLLMMEHDFICASANIVDLDEAAKDMPIVRTRVDNTKLKTIMSNSFGFGGTNATLVFRHYN